MEKRFYKNEDSKKSQPSGINSIGKWEVTMEGKTIYIPLTSFCLQQSVRTPHIFELTLPNDSFASAEDCKPEQSPACLGKRITVVCQCQYENNTEKSTERSFVGMVTEVLFDQDKPRDIVIKGHGFTLFYL